MADAQSMPSGAPRSPEEIYADRLAGFERQIAVGLDVHFERNIFRSLEKRFLIAHSPRVGSHLLCEGLLAYGAAVEEFFEVSRILNASRRRGFSTLQQYCEWLLGEYSVGGVFGVSGGVKALTPIEMAGEFPEFASQWRFVHLTRRDFVEQSVSEFIAMTTGAYKSTRDPTKILVESDYDAQKIRSLIDATLTVNSAWEGAFKVYGVEPLRLVYEDLAADPDRVIAGAAAFLSLSGPPITDPKYVRPPLAKQATELNSIWAARFREENRAFCTSRAAGVFEPHRVRMAPHSAPPFISSQSRPGGAQNARGSV